ncbi:MAG: ATP-binding cassette domain-containing protein, partial [Oscillospiraceae bacterium]|nr:ATP-binding cassette domain-containing protein [Oscillospiraceae bacterium]
ALCKLNGLLDRHPYDLSGGEQQRVALAKILLQNPDIILMDEPTKGLDGEFKTVFAEILEKLKKQGKCIVMVSHDVDFCATYADRCGLFFDGTIVSEDAPRPFFSGKNFYTTAANRMSRHIIPNAVTADDVILAYKGCADKKRIVSVDEEPADIAPPASRKPNNIPLWQRIAGAISGIIFAILLVIISIKTDLSELYTND